MSFPHRLLRLCAFLVLLHISAVSQAADVKSTKSNSDDSIWVQVDDKTGLTNSLPSVTAAVLVEQMKEACSNLQVQKVDLARIVEASKLDTKDGVIAAILPGGLLYAAIIRQRHKRAVSHMESAVARLDEMSQNLADFKSAIF